MFQQGKVILAIPPRRVPMGAMTATSPSKVTPEGLSEMLHNMGLTCEQADPSNLQGIIDEVTAKLPNNGTANSFLIDTTQETPAGPVPSFLVRQQQMKPTRASHLVKDDQPPNLKQVADSEWSPDAVGKQYATDLAVINANFTKLANFYPGFQGISATPFVRQGTYSTAAAIEDIVLSVAVNLNAQVITGIDRPTLLAVLSNAIPPSEANSHDYNETANRLVFLVLDYNPEKQDCAGIGFVYIQYHIQIKDHLNKITKQIKHKTSLTINTHSIIYSDVNAMQAQIAWLNHDDARATLAVRGIPPKYQFKIFDSLPPLPTEETFGCALPLESKGDQLTSLVFYGSNLMNLGNLDNKTSQASSLYSVATTSGVSQVFLSFFFF
jgi:hypothetical protein